MCPLWKNFEPNSMNKLYPRAIKDSLKMKLPNPLWLTENAKDLIENLLILNPAKRWSAKQAIDAEYFYENPIFKPAEKLNMNLGIDSVHEWEAREKHRQMMQQRASTGK
jgi:cyclin-dependent kinase 12/13